MNYAELLAQSRPGVSADGICCYRVSPLEAKQAEEMVDIVDAMDSVQSAWVDKLPNSMRVCLMWLPSSPKEQSALFDDFVDGEIEKGYLLWKSGHYCIGAQVHTWYDKRNVLQYENRTYVENLTTDTCCYLIRNDNANRCFQGQRCGLCKHEVTAVLAGEWDNHHLSECIENWLKKKGIVK